MSGIRLGSNIASLQALRHFDRSTRELSSVMERLSSGLRLNRASDDAAGLAIADSLRADQRVYTQGIRNINDGVSLLNTAEGALSSATDIGIRIRELATQSANGTLTSAQRRALHNEANRLVDEFNRLTATVSFNGRNLLVANFGTLTIQNSYGTNGGVSVQLNEQLSRTIGSGSFGSAISSATSSNSVQNVITTDLNGDGKADAVVQMSLGFNVGVMLGNGDGTFGAMTTYSLGANPSDVVVADITGDGKVDIAAASSTGQNISVFQGNGNGTFQAGVSTSVGANVYGLASSDFNGDGKSDLMVQTSSDYRVFLSSSGGNFQSPTTLSTSSTGSFDSGMQLADVTGDGVIDLVATMQPSHTIEVFAGSGNGQFTLRNSYSTGITSVRDIVAADFDGDNDIDFAVANPDGSGGKIGIWSNDGSGNFTRLSLLDTPTTNIWNLNTADINNDGVADLVSTDGTTSNMQVYLGRGDGTFDSPIATALGSNTLPPNLGDVNGDGVLDSLTGGTGLNVRLGTTSTTTMLPRLDLMSAASARQTFSTIDSFLTRTKRELGSIGAFRSRLETALSSQTVQNNEFGAAESRLRDADVAEDSARATRLSILQQAGLKVLSLANLQPEMALRLLRPR